MCLASNVSWVSNFLPVRDNEQITQGNAPQNDADSAASTTRPSLLSDRLSAPVPSVCPATPGLRGPDGVARNLASSSLMKMNGSWYPAWSSCLASNLNSLVSWVPCHHPLYSSPELLVPVPRILPKTCGFTGLLTHGCPGIFRASYALLSGDHLVLPVHRMPCPESQEQPERAISRTASRWTPGHSY